MTTLVRPWGSLAPARHDRPRPRWPVLLLGAAVLGGVSLLVLPNGIAYDPWSWLIWGRQSLHLSLDTTAAATSIKPLPMGIDTLLALFGGAAPTLWLFVARTAALAGVGAAFRVADRLAGPVAGVLAGFAVVTSSQYAAYLFFTGMSEPMTVAFALGAVDAALSRRHRTTFVMLIATALLRLEAWPFVVLYGAWWFWRDRTWRRGIAVAAGYVVLPLAWFGLDWLGSGHFLRSASAASQESQGGPLLTSHPGLATVTETWHLLVIPIAVVALATFAVSLVRWRRSQRARVFVMLGLSAALWLAVAASMAQLRIATGAIRYLLPAAALAAVVGGCGVALAARAVRRWVSPSRRHGSGRRWPGLVAAAVIVAAVIGGSVPGIVRIARSVNGERTDARQLEALDRGLTDAVQLAGGHRGLMSCGHVATAAYQVPALTWQANLTFEEVNATPAPTGTIMQFDGRPAVAAGGFAGYHRLGTAGPAFARWVVYSSCG